MTTRTDNDTGIFTLPEGHGLQVNDLVNLAHVTLKTTIRYGMTVTNVDGNLVTLDGGAGQNLPAQGSSVAVAPVEVIDTPDIDTTKIKFLAVAAQRVTRLEFRAAAGAVIWSRELAAGELYLRAANSGAGELIPVANTIATIRAANNETPGTATLTIAFLLDS